MSKIIFNDIAYGEFGSIGGGGDGGGGDVNSSDIPTSNMIAEFDNDAHMNSADMSNNEIEDFVESLDISAVHAVDYVVEQGTEGIWTYRKWNSGIAECWGVSTISGTWSSWDTMYYIQASFSYPFTFISRPSTQARAEALATISNSSVMSVGSYSGLSEENMKSSCNIALCRPSAGTNNVAYPISIYAIGRWK